MPKYYLFIFLWIQSKKVQKTTFTSFAIASKHKKLDAITEQMLNTTDARIEMMNRWNSGALCQWWEEKGNKGDSATIVGDLMDKLCGWGRYHPDIQKSKTLKKQRQQTNAFPDSEGQYWTTVL
jgi:hypothetical protein